MKSALKNKLDRLKNILKKMGSCLLAYSGGVDSTFLLKACCDALGRDKVLAVTADSATYPASELEFSRKMAKRLKVRHLVIQTKELQDSRFVKNTINRCYYCKLGLFRKLKQIARQNKIKYILDASQTSDKFDFRPGDRAKKQLKIRSPLKEAGFTKEEIRLLSRLIGLETSDKPSSACLASRFPYGSRITRRQLRKVEKAEGLLMSLGFRQVRVRNYDNTARIEVEREYLGKLMERLNNKIIGKLKGLGFKYITVDLEGYRTGSMNELIKEW